MSMPEEKEFNNDHDALITLISEFRNFRLEINEKVRELKDNTIDRLNKLETRNLELEKRVEVLENKVSNQKLAIAIYLSVGVVLASAIFYHIIAQ